MKRWSRNLVLGSALACGPVVLQAQSVLDVNLCAYGPGNQYARDIIVDATGNQYVGGSFESTTTFDFYHGTPSFTSTGMLDGFIGRWNETLMELQWLVLLKSAAGNDEVNNVAVYPDGNNGVNTYITGFFTGASATIQNVYVSGGGGGTSLTLTAPSGNPADVTAFICKINAAGAPVWAAVTGSASTAGADVGNEIVVNTNGTSINVYATGSYRDNVTFYHSTGAAGPVLAGSSTNDHAFVSCYTDNGTTATCNWANSIASPGADGGWGLDADATGHVYVAGTYAGNPATVGTTSGTPVSLSLSGAQDIFVVCYTNAGVIGWATRFGGPSTVALSDQVQGVAVDRNGDVYLAGSFQTSITFGSTTLTSAGSWDVFVAKLYSNFTSFSVAWAVRGGSGGADRAYDIAMDNCGARCYVAGDYRGTATFGSYTLPPYNSGVANQDGFLAEFDANTGAAVYAFRTGGASDHDALMGIDVNAVGNVYACCRTASTSGNLVFTNAGATGTYESYHFQWDHSNFPTSVSGNATNTGVGMRQCNIFTSGTMENTVTFGSTTLSSVSGSKDAYMTRTDYYGNYDMFVRVTNGTADEITTDQSGDIYGGQAISGYSSRGNTTSFFGYSGNASTKTQPVGFVCKVNGVYGNVMWAVYAEGSTMARVNAVTTDAGGNFFICGEFEGKLTFVTPTNAAYDPNISSTGRDFFFARISSSGNVTWVNTGGNRAKDVTAYGIAIDQSNHMYITGTFTGASCTFHNGSAYSMSSANFNDLFVAHYTYTSSSSTLVNVLAYQAGGLETGYDVTAVSSQEVYFTGVKSSGNTSVIGRCNMSSATPVLNWTRSNTSGTAAGYEVEYMNGFVFMGGAVGGSPGFGALAVGCMGTGIIVKYDAATGNEICLQCAPINVFDMCSFAGTNAADYGDVLLASGGQQITSGISQAYAAKINFQGCSAAFRLAGTAASEEDEAAVALATSASASFFPNPSNGNFTLRISGAPESISQLVISDLSGRVVYAQSNILPGDTPVNCDALSTGVYVYTLTTNGKTETGKLMIAE